ncbi:MAG TPA: right-handed parallel beta-helix repeat-containing protein, partial [Hanamia sp.]|nr:right-handed parallel beta-helix repeat-containing protein [Hanamia sp.]
MIKYFSLILFFAGTGNAVQAQKIINLSDYGVVPDSYQNASANIARAINDAAGFDSCIIKFPGGRIDLWPDGASKHIYYISNATENDSLSKEKTIGMLFKGLSNITLEGNNTSLVYHGKMMLMAIDHCHNFKVNNLLFDFQRPTMSEMKIISKTDSDVIVNINRDSWYAIEKQDNHNQLIWYGEGWKTNNPFLIDYTPSQETMGYGSWNFFSNSNAIELSPFKVRFEGNFKESKFEAGDMLSVRDPYRDEVGVFNNCSSDVSFENLKFYYIHGLGIVSQLSKNIFIRNVSIAPKPGSGRVIAAFADCFHFSGCYGLVRIENSFCSGSHDDPVNIHGTALRIIKADSNKIIVRFMHDQTWGFNAFEKSDSIEFVNHKTLLPFGTAVVKSSKMISQKEIELELNIPVPKQWQESDCVENISKTPSVVIKNNRFEHTETRGLLVTTRRSVLIESNTFYRTGMHAILIADDCNSWFESGPVKNVIIRNNKFIDCGYNSAPDDYVIFIKPETNHFEKGRYVHSNISITGNEFQVFDSPVLFAENVNGLIFNGNYIVQKSLPGFPSGMEPAFSLEHCNEVQILNNNFVGGSLPKEI